LVAGPLALTVGFCELTDIPALAILAYADPVRPDPFAASVVVQDLSRFLDKEINTTHLIEDAARIERELEETRLQSQEEKEAPSGLRRLYI
jgi:predicted ATP-grasp superfamily ATP-dependent carboligase